jgi:hypothetical protein
MFIRQESFLIFLPPLFLLTLGCVSGIIGSMLAAPFIALSTAVIIVGATAYYTTTPLLRKFSLYFLIGICAGIVRVTSFDVYNAYCHSQLHDLSSIEGTVIEKNELLEYPKRIQLGVATYLGDMLLYAPPALEIIPGDTVRINLSKLKKTTNEKFATYLHGKGHIASLYLKEEDIRLISRPRYSLRRFIFEINQHLFTIYHSLLSRNTLTCFYALFLGNKHILKQHFNTIKEKFNRWGLAHFLARSGLHLVMFVAIWVTVLKIIPANFFIKQLLLLLLTSLYLLFSWSSIPFARAFLAFIYQLGCKFTDTQIHPLQTVSVALLLLLLYNPYQILLLEFQLTATLTLGLLLFYWNSKILSY